MAQPSVDVKKDNVCGATSMSVEKYTACTVCGDRCVEGMKCTNCTELEVSKCVSNTNPKARMIRNRIQVRKEEGVVADKR